MIDILQSIPFIIVAFLLGILVGICIWEVQRQMRSGKHIKAYCPICKRLNSSVETITLEHTAFNFYKCSNCGAGYNKEV